MNLMAEMQKINEAYCVRHGIQVERKFSDDDIAEAGASVADAERELYGQMGADERLGRLSTDEQALLDNLNAAPLIPFRVTTSIGSRQDEQISILARTSCDAATQAIQLLLSDSGDCITAGFKVKVEPITRKEYAPCAA